MKAYITEIIDAHIAIENWLSRGEGELEALMARFAENFSMVTLSGASLDYAALARFFQAQRGSRAGLKIVVDNIEPLAEWEDGAVIGYRETQGEHVRWSTVVFQFQQGRVLWRHLHETAQAA